MVDKNKLLRFGVIWKNVPYDLFSLFKLRDETICLVTYMKSSKMGAKEIGTVSEGRDQFDVNLREIPLCEFTSQKMSFHPSGYIHTTNERDERISELDGSRGLSFKEIVDFLFLFSLYPMRPENYRKHTGLSKKSILVDVRSLGYLPYRVTCYLSKSDYDFTKEIQRINGAYEEPRSLFICFKNYVPTYSLDLFVRFHKSSAAVFPIGQGIVHLRKP